MEGRGVTYCAQVQAVAATSPGGSQLSARVCAATFPNAPGAPTSLSFVPLNQGVDLTFGAATNATPTPCPSTGRCC